MGLVIRYTKSAEKFLSRQPPQIQRRIRAAIAALPYGDVKKLTGNPYFRLRVGNYRVIFDRNGNVIEIVRIDNRGQVYK